MELQSVTKTLIDVIERLVYLTFNLQYKKAIFFLQTYINIGYTHSFMSRYALLISNICLIFKIDCFKLIWLFY